MRTCYTAPNHTFHQWHIFQCILMLAHLVPDVVYRPQTSQYCLYQAARGSPSAAVTLAAGQSGLC